MTSELLTLVLSAVLCLALPAVYGPLVGKQIGMDALKGNREGLPEPTGAAGRGLRAHRNLIENLIPYAIAVLTAHAIGLHNGITVLAAWLFLLSRLAHAATYIAGITGARTIAYVVSIASTLAILLQLPFH